MQEDASDVLIEHLRRFPGYFKPFDWHHLLVCVPGMAACLIWGLITGDTITAAIAAGSAFSVGFGLRRKRQVRSMLGAVGLMTAAALIGSLIGGSFILFLVILALSAAGCACLALVDEDMWWVSLQATIALMLASAYAGDLKAALMRAAIVCAAGLAQMALVIMLDRLVPRPPVPPANPAPVATRRALTVYGLVAASSVGLALTAAHGLHLQKAYWAPMTALIVLKPKFHLTRQRGWERLLGNLGGCAAATLITLVLPPLHWLDSVLCIAGSGASYALLRARYAAFSLAVSFTAVMLLHTAHVSAVFGSEQRLYATALGGLIAMAVMWAASKTVARDFAI
ncbi:MAG: FUSC family protein [Asticcacaulis sp.]